MNDNKKLKQKISETTSKGITSLRYLLSVLIVFAHNNFTVADIAEKIYRSRHTSYFCAE